MGRERKADPTSYSSFLVFICTLCCTVSPVRPGPSFLHLYTSTGQHSAWHIGVTKQMSIEKMPSGEETQSRLEWKGSNCLKHIGLDSSQYSPTERVVRLQNREITESIPKRVGGRKPISSAETSSVFTCSSECFPKASHCRGSIQAVFRKPETHHISQEPEFRVIRTIIPVIGKQHKWGLVAKMREFCLMINT